MQKTKNRPTSDEETIRQRFEERCCDVAFVPESAWKWIINRLNQQGYRFTFSEPSQPGEFSCSIELGVQGERIEFISWKNIVGREVSEADLLRK